MIPLNTRIRNNDPRSDGRERTIVGFVAIDLHGAVPVTPERATHVVAESGMGRVRIRLDRIHADGKPRRSGWSVVAILMLAVAAAHPARAQPPSAQPQTYTLITVTQAGDVRHSDGWTTLDLCLDAESMARTGMTVAQAKKREEEGRAASEKAAAEWRAAHPPRAPKNDFERLLTSGSGLRFGSMGFSGEGNVSSCGDHQVCDEPGTLTLLSSGWRSSDALKYAECVIVPARP